MRSKNKKDQVAIRDRGIIGSVEALDNLVRAEYNTTNNFLDYFAGKDSINKVNSIKNQVIYGRRGTGKTHLLRALQESILGEKNRKFFSIYIDVRSFKPMLSDDNPLYYSLIMFREIVIEMLRCSYINIAYLYEVNEFDAKDHAVIAAKQALILSCLNRFNATFDGTSFKRMGDVEFSISAVNTLAASLQISNSFGLTGNAERSKQVSTTDGQIKYISFAEMSDVVKCFLDDIEVERFFCLIDEWSEIPLSIQPLLAELFKRAFIPHKLTLKIAAIPNRTSLMANNSIGLEDGGDIFGLSLDDRFVYELQPESTKTFFNELLFNQLHLVNPVVFSSFSVPTNSSHANRFLNYFLANQSLREILIASAGIPRDFLSIFISSYRHFIERESTNHNHIALTDVRSATVQWYEVDKKRAVEANHNAKIMLDKIIQDILLVHKVCHFLVPEKYENQQTLKDLMDLRVIHLRRRSISHKGNSGVSYNVYYLDYACYTSSNIYHNRINSNFINELEAIDDFRTIRRVSLEDKFFDTLNAEIGNGFKCPHCNAMVNVLHPAYIKQKICDKCFEKVEN